jgi:hypothetical protein
MNFMPHAKETSNFNEIQCLRTINQGLLEQIARLAEENKKQSVRILELEERMSNVKPDPLI